MPQLPFTFKDVVNAKHPSDIIPKKESEGEAQNFLASKIDGIKKHMTVEGAVDLGLAINPVTRAVDMGSKFFGGKGIHKEFVDATTATGDVRVPPLMF